MSSAKYVAISKLSESELTVITGRLIRLIAERVLSEIELLI